MEIEKATRGGKYFLSGILNLQKGIKIISTNPILSDAINIGGTELFSANFATGKALPCAAIIKSKINKCLIGKSLTHCERIRHWLIRGVIPSCFNSRILFN